MPAIYIMACAGISALAALSVHERSREAISDSVLTHLAPATVVRR